MYIKSYDGVSSHSSRAAHLEKKIFEALLYSLSSNKLKTVSHSHSCTTTIDYNIIVPKVSNEQAVVIFHR